jgi:hypothetical protein
MDELLKITYHLIVQDATMDLAEVVEGVAPALVVVHLLVEGDTPLLVVAGAEVHPVLVDSPLPVLAEAHLAEEGTLLADILDYRIAPVSDPAVALVVVVGGQDPFLAASDALLGTVPGADLALVVLEDPAVQAPLRIDQGMEVVLLVGVSRQCILVVAWIPDQVAVVGHTAPTCCNRRASRQCSRKRFQWCSLLGPRCLLFIIIRSEGG